MNQILSLIGFNGALNLFYSMYFLMFIQTFYGYKNYNFLDLMYVCLWFCFPYARSWGVYNGFAGVNYRLNGFLKNLIKQPRPTKMQFIHPSDVQSSKEYGMPSGHAQLTSAIMTFLILEFDNPYISAISILQLCLTLIQRYVYRMHSISQLIVGTIIGSLSGWIFYFIFNKISNRNSNRNINLIRNSKCNKIN